MHKYDKQRYKLAPEYTEQYIYQLNVKKKLLQHAVHTKVTALLISAIEQHQQSCWSAVIYNTTTVDTKSK